MLLAKECCAFCGERLKYENCNSNWCKFYGKNIPKLIQEAKDSGSPFRPQYPEIEYYLKIIG